MPGYLCKCDVRMDYTEIPAACSYYLVEDAAVDIQEDITTHQAAWTDLKNVLRCPACGRLWIFWNGMALAPTEYECRGVDDRTSD
jgi:hypothetical protein